MRRFKSGPEEMLKVPAAFEIKKSLQGFTWSCEFPFALIMHEAYVQWLSYKFGLFISARNLSLAPWSP